MDKIAAAAAIIRHALPLVAFDGWTQATLSRAALAAGYQRGDAIRVFPGGAQQAVAAYFTLADSQMLDALSRYHLDSMKIRERVALAVRLWLEGQQEHKEALRRAVALQSMPFNAAQGLTSLYHTTDAIWHAIGDRSTDFNFYTKRLLLAGVFSSTLLYWLNDSSAGHEASWAFLARRIDNVMHIEKTKHQLKSWFATRRKA
jgi:ubiquinone biosynthesis protein COQ9